MERVFLRGETTTLPAVTGRLRLLSRLGKGGMAEVFLAELQGAGAFRRRVVAKRMRPDLAARPLWPEMFEREAATLARLHHPNIVGVVDFAEFDGERWLLLEHVDGPTLQALARPERRLPVAAVVAAIADAARALHVVHAALDDDGAPLGLIHRDVSPDNLAVTSLGVLKLLDFGIARGKSSPALTTVGALKGKLPYMAPEQLKGRPVDGRADLWALGVCLHQLLTGHRPFKGQSEIALMTAIVEEHPPPPSLSAPGVPADVDEVVARLLRKRPAERFATGKDVADALQAALPTTSFSLARLLAPDDDADAVDDDATARVARSLFAAPQPAPAPPPASSPPAPAWLSLGDDDIVSVDEASGVVERVATVTRTLDPPRRLAETRPPTVFHGPLPERRRSSVVPAVVGAIAGAAIVVVVGAAVFAKDPPPPPVIATTTPEPPPPAPPPLPEPPPPEPPPPTPPTPAPTPTTTTTAPIKRGRGTLTVLAVPYARVSVDGDDVGDTPVDALALDAGVHRVVLRGDNGDVVREATVKSGKTTTLKVKMP